MLVDMPWIHGVPAVQFRHRAEVYKPVHLNGLPQITGCMGRNPMAHFGNLLQFMLALGILFLGSHLLGQFGMTLCKEDGGIARDGHRLQFLLLVCRLGVINIVQALDLRLDTGLHVE